MIVWITVGALMFYLVLLAFYFKLAQLTDELVYAVSRSTDSLTRIQRELEQLRQGHAAPLKMCHVPWEPTPTRLQEPQRGSTNAPSPGAW